MPKYECRCEHKHKPIAFDSFLVRAYDQSGRFLKQVYSGKDLSEAIHIAELVESEAKLYGLIFPGSLNAIKLPENSRVKKVYKPAPKPIYIASFL